jgi:hypothetical protein
VLAFVAVVAAIDQDVGGQGRKAGRDFPDVEVVHVAYAVDCVEVGVDGGDVDSTWGGFEEDPPGLANEFPAGFRPPTSGAGKSSSSTDSGMSSVVATSLSWASGSVAGTGTVLRNIRFLQSNPRLM